MPFKIVRNDITKMNVDIIVNTANPLVQVGVGVDSSIYEVAGIKLLKERKKIGNLPVGQVGITKAYGLNARYIIHTVGPEWKGGNHKEGEVLRECYINSLHMAKKYGCESIAFPLISTGTNGFPKEDALQIATSVFSEFLLQEDDMMIYLVVYDQKSFQLSKKLFQDVQTFIDEKYISKKSTNNSQLLDFPYENRSSRNLDKTYDMDKMTSANQKWPVTKNFESAMPPTMKHLAKSRSLDDLLKDLDDTFSESLLRLIDEKEKSDVEVYKKSNIDRKLFSKIRSNPNYKPSKQTAVALAIGLELNLDETKDLIGRAGFALTHSSKFDIIIEYFIEQKNYNIFEINGVLFAFDQPLLGK